MKRSIVFLSAVLLLCGCGGSGQGGDRAAESDEARANRDAVQEVQREEERQESLNAKYADDPAADLIQNTLLFTGRGQYGRAWDILHPAHQSLVSRGDFEDCGRQGGGASVEEIDIVEVYDDPLDVAFIPEKQSRAVTVEVLTTAGVATQTFHAVEVDGSSWRWVLSSQAARSQANECRA